MQIDHNHDTVVIMDHNMFCNNTAKEKEIVDIAFIQVILKKIIIHSKALSSNVFCDTQFDGMIATYFQT